MISQQNLKIILEHLFELRQMCINNLSTSHHALQKGNYLNYLNYHGYPNLMLHFQDNIQFEKMQLAWIDRVIKEVQKRIK